MLSNGGSILSADKKSCVANKPESVKVIETLGKIVTDGYAVPGAATLKDEESLGLFFNGKTVLEMTSGPSYDHTQMKDFNDKAVIEGFGMPTADGKTPMTTITWGANTFAIFKNNQDANKIAAAKEFTRFYLNNPTTMLKDCKAGGTAPVLNDLKVDFSEDPALGAITEQVTKWTGEYAVTSAGLLEPFWPEVRSNFYPELQAVYSGKKTAQEAMDTFAANVNAILAKQ